MASTSSLRLITLFMGMLLSGCCANNVCNCNDEQEDSIKLRLTPDPSGINGFSATELDTIIIKRFPKKFTSLTVPESVTLPRTGESIELSNTAPFTRNGSARLSQYRYVIQYLKDQQNSRPILTNALVIDSVLLKGSYDGSGCCTCYHNTAKGVYLNGQLTDLQQNSVLTIPK
ncbi:hypothetical protein [Hymenobacter negativus]|uniref:Uncharacterized protein n=1 Tax=Hymenobacter negativus TaxID=2795026 RepID=A0ABS3QA48_9BACT|nr:hypothetical protein [Hymenobacter negativus]MBO2008017.1 hypothetical protein [Hymenobacter negativus]